MDIYGLILDKGLIGALEYSAIIEPTNIRLSSKIDKIVYRLWQQSQPTSIRTAQNLNLMPVQPYQQSAEAPQQPVQGPPRSAQRLEDVIGPEAAQIAKSDPLWIGLVRELAGAGYSWNIIKEYLIGNKTRQDAFKALLANIGTASTIGQQEALKDAAKILASTPATSVKLNNAVTTLRNTFLNLAENELKANPEALNMLKNEAIHNLLNPSPNLLQRGFKGIQKYTGGNELGSVHPSLANLPHDLNNVFGAKELAGKSPQQIIDALNEKLIKLNPMSSESTSLQLLRDEVLRASKGTIGTDAAKTLATGLSENENFLSKLLYKLPFGEVGKKIASLGGKVLGPLFVVLQSKGIFDEYQQYGADNKFWCDFVTVLASAASLIPPLLPFAGPLAVILGVGCMFVHHDEKKALTQQDVEARSKTITLNDLSPKDQDNAQKIYNAYKDDHAKLDSEFNKAVSENVFEKPLDVMAALYKQNESGGVFAQPPAATVPPSGQAPIVASFNYRLYCAANLN